MKALRATPYPLVFGNTHSWMCFSMRSQHSSHTNPRDYLSFHFMGGKKKGRQFLDSLTSKRPLSVERLHWHCGGLSSAGNGAAHRGQGLGLELRKWTAAAGAGRVWPKPTKQGSRR